MFKKINFHQKIGNSYKHHFKKITAKMQSTTIGGGSISGQNSNFIKNNFNNKISEFLQGKKFMSMSEGMIIMLYTNT